MVANPRTIQRPIITLDDGTTVIARDQETLDDVVPGQSRARRVLAMARVVVVGGGYGGLASAARLAKLGHDVTLLESGPRLGGAIGYVEQDGFRWDAGPTSTLLPAVMRDLFRKSGRALEKEVELVPVEPVASTASTTTSCSTSPAAAAAPRSPRSTRRSGPGRASAGRRTSRLRRRLGGAAPRLARAALLRRAREQAHQGAALDADDAAQGAAEDLQGRAAAGRSRRSRWRSRATTCATCPRGWACGPTSSSGSARGRCPAGWARSPTRSPRGSRPAA